MRVDTLVVEQPPVVIAVLLRWVMSVVGSVRGVLERGEAPTFAEMSSLIFLGLLFGFLFQAYSVKVLLLMFVLALGCAWGMVIGIVVERVHATA